VTCYRKCTSALKFENTLSQCLRRIVVALSASLIPMCSAFAVLLLISAIYSVLAVDLYGHVRPAYFGSFSASLFTMFQVCTQDNWTELVREMSMMDTEKDVVYDHATDFSEAAVTIGHSMFFVSYVVFVGIIVLNIVVAVLLDEFVESVTKDRKQEQELLLKMAKSKERSFGSPLDPLLQVLSHFTTSLDLSDRINKIFTMIDPEVIGTNSQESAP
jgi:voltage-gated sodium channel